MKNATKHADDLKSLFRKLLRENGKPDEKPTYPAVDALVRGAMSYDVPDARADEAMAAIGREFVDLNELRVATELEVQELIGPKYPDVERRITTTTLALNAIFEREHTLNLDRLRDLPKKEARQFLRELPEIHPFVEAYVMLFALDGSAVPVDESTVNYLVDQDVLEEGTSLEEAQKFLEHHLKAEEQYEFYAAVRAAIHGAEEPKKAKAGK